jgi:hypothetical protein
MPNSLFKLHAYLKDNTWMFDDEKRGIVEEPFVAGADIMFDFMSGRVMSPANDTCDIVFSATPIPDHDVHATLTGDDGHDGHYYDVQKFNQFPEGVGFEFWLCPALLEFFNKAPDNLYVKVQ